MSLLLLMLLLFSQNVDDWYIAGSLFNVHVIKTMIVKVFQSAEEQMMYRVSKKKLQ